MYKFLLLKMLYSSNKTHLVLTNVLPLLYRRVQEKQTQLLTHPWSSYCGQARAWGLLTCLRPGLLPGGGGAMTGSPNETTLCVDGVPKEK